MPMVFTLSGLRFRAKSVECMKRRRWMGASITPVNGLDMGA